MLVLSRFEGEEIMIGPEISVRVTRVKGKKVRLMVKAPTSLAVHRREVFDQINDERNRQQQPGDPRETGPPG